jgi:hypothetical protein
MLALGRRLRIHSSCWQATLMGVRFLEPDFPDYGQTGNKNIAAEWMAIPRETAENESRSSDIFPPIERSRGIASLIYVAVPTAGARQFL